MNENTRRGMTRASAKGRDDDKIEVNQQWLYN